MRALPPSRDANNVSGDQAVSLPALLIEGSAIWLLGIASGTVYHLVAFGYVGEIGRHAGLGFLVAVLYSGAIRVSGSTRPLRITGDVGRARQAVTTWLGTFLFLSAVAFSLRIGAVFSRGSIFCFFLAGLPLTVATRVLVPPLLMRTLQANRHRGSEVIVAAPRAAPALAPLSSELRTQGCAAIHIVEFDADCPDPQWPSERNRLLKRLLETARIAGPGEIYLLSAPLPPARVSSILVGLRPVPRAIHVVPDDSVGSLLGRPLRRVGSALAVEVQRVPMSRASRAAKRAIDMAVAGLALVLTLPAFTLIALAVKLDSPGPVFFLQRRNGYRGKTFKIVKFRTMTVLEDGDDVTQVQRGDPRVTRIGHWLRKTSFDELPQLLNILRGEMSLVGPRPHAVAHDELYAKLIENYELRQHVKPGVTGWAQVNGLRGETPTVDLMFRRIECDLWYAANASLMLDMQILVRTLLTVIRQDNAF